LGVEIGPSIQMALTPLPSSIGRGSNPPPTDRDLSVLPLDHSFRFVLDTFSLLRVSSFLGSVDQFDAIMFHTYRISKELPSLPRKHFQRYIMFDQESPLMGPMSKDYDNYFNWTMTYRMDSDFTRAYGWFKPVSSDNRYPLSDHNKLNLSYPTGNGND